MLHNEVNHVFCNSCSPALTRKTIIGSRPSVVGRQSVSFIEARSDSDLRAAPCRSSSRFFARFFSRECARQSFNSPFEIVQILPWRPTIKASNSTASSEPGSLRACAGFQVRQLPPYVTTETPVLNSVLRTSLVPLSPSLSCVALVEERDTM